MAHVKENDLMIGFYLSSPILQRKILAQYQDLRQKNRKRESLVNFLEDNFKVELDSIPNNKSNSSSISSKIALLQC